MRELWNHSLARVATRPFCPEQPLQRLWNSLREDFQKISGRTFGGIPRELSEREFAAKRLRPQIQRYSKERRKLSLDNIECNV